MARKVNIEIEQGATFTYTVDLKNADNTDFDVTNWTGRGQIRKHYIANTAYDFTVALANGSMTFSMNATSTANIAYGLYVYDLEIEHTDATVRRVVSGMAQVTPEVTKT